MKAILCIEINATKNEKLLLWLQKFIFRHKWTGCYMRNVCVSIYYQKKKMFSNELVSLWLIYCLEELELPDRRYTLDRKYLHVKGNWLHSAMLEILLIYLCFLYWFCIWYPFARKYLLIRIHCAYMRSEKVVSMKVCI